MKPRIAAVVACCKFPYAGQMLRALSKQVDDIYVRFDVLNGDPELQMGLNRYCAGKLRHIDIAQGWTFPDWREECLNIIHKAQVKPDLVLIPDEDEMFDEGIEEELLHFWNSDKKGMMFSYHPLESNDGRLINMGKPYPPDPHMKAFKYAENLSYIPYHGDAKIAQYHKPKDWFLAKTKIRHYSALTKMMQEKKRWRSDTPIGRGTKAVTLLGFGPSSGGNLQFIGEPWTLNNYWDVCDPRLAKRITRVFDMHKFGERSGGHWDKVRDWLAAEHETKQALDADGQLRKREDLPCRDGKPYTWHLKEAADRGTRVILQEPHPDVPGSEAYPLNKVQAALGLANEFGGTPAYMLAIALVEGYNHVRIYGLDQMDPEHTIQRESFIHLLGIAKGMGVRIDGAETWRKHYTKKYGYDYGPEGGPYQEALAWRGHPYMIRSKMPSRAVRGDMCQAIGG